MMMMMQTYMYIYNNNNPADPSVGIWAQVAQGVGSSTPPFVGSLFLSLWETR